LSGLANPALLTKTETLYLFNSQNLNILSGDFLSLRSHGYTEVLTLKLSDISLAKAFNLSLDLAVRIILYPRLAKDLAIYKPIPEDAPVTNAKAFVVFICFVIKVRSKIII